MRQKILIVGGYGAVGGHIAKKLSQIYPGNVIVAGRNLEKAKRMGKSLNNSVIAMQLDISALPSDDTFLNDVMLVVMCIEQESIAFVKRCINNGIHYIDISASIDYLKAIEALHKQAVQNRSIVLLSVGIAPGLSNLLVKHCKNTNSDIKDVDIFILLGLGEAHGEAAIRWSIEQLNTEFGDNVGNRFESFTDGTETLFPNERSKRTAYRFNFSDQHVLPRTLSLRSVSTRLCFESRVMTTVYSLLKKAGVSRVFKWKFAQDIMTKIIRRMRFGTDIFSVKIEAFSGKDKDLFYACSITGHEEAKFTGLVAAKTAEKIVEASFPCGVFHIEQCFEPMEIINTLTDYGLQFEEGGRH